VSRLSWAGIDEFTESEADNNDMPESCENDAADVLVTALDGDSPDDNRWFPFSFRQEAILITAFFSQDRPFSKADLKFIWFVFRTMLGVQSKLKIVFESHLIILYSAFFQCDIGES
jgi:hypothetical protein